MKKDFLLVTAALLSGTATAGGLLHHEVATFDSVSSAGVGNASNRHDASAIITSPAGLTGIEDSSWSFGVQWMDVGNRQQGTLNNEDFVLKGSNSTVLPSIAYAKRISDDMVIGLSFHAEGGLDLDYTSQTSGARFISNQSQNAVNVHLGAGYELNQALSVGGALIVQHVMTSLKVDTDVSSYSVIKAEGHEGNTAASFMLSAFYDLAPNTYISANYKHQVSHSNNSITIKGSVDGEPDQLPPQDISITWPSQLNFGVAQQLSENLTLKGLLGAEFWSNYSDRYNTKDVYTLGASLGYQLNRWNFQVGARYDTKLLDEKDMHPELVIGENWSLGAGAERVRRNGHRIGLAYQYRDFGTHDVSYTLDDTYAFTGKVKNNNLHVVSLSYTY
ncbi:OmpP1/FadL family transporter [Vibrio sp. WXL103]|uniref:OmpP1/FadL family transporter n=1 Tax=Vibrio sp. WXL103 TaxID=3450710 RepID=UPI003EC7A9EE